MSNLTLPAKVTRHQLAALLNLSVRSVDQLAARGRIPFFKIGKSVRFDPIEVEAHLRQTAHVNAQTR
jgi:excisionase family DNA binding protein